jgi:hypothetical protein
VFSQAIFQAGDVSARRGEPLALAAHVSLGHKGCEAEASTHDRS